MFHNELETREIYVEIEIGHFNFFFEIKFIHHNQFVSPTTKFHILNLTVDRKKKFLHGPNQTIKGEVIYQI